MVLKTRNRLTLAVLFFSLFSIMAASIIFIQAVTSNQILPPPLAANISHSSIFFLKYSFPATLLAIALLILYVPVTLFLIYVNFEKTQASEIVFFILFLIGCLTELSRLLNPLFGLWRSFSTFFIISNRFVLFGRILAPLSLLFSTLMNEAEQRQDIERNLTVVIAVAAVFAIIIPLDTAHITPTCTIPWAYGHLFTGIFALISITTAVTLFLKAKNQDSKEMLEIFTGFILLCSGYNILTAAYNWGALTAGVLLLATGTFRYLKSLHILYLWQ